MMLCDRLPLSANTRLHHQSVLEDIAMKLAEGRLDNWKGVFDREPFTYNGTWKLQSLKQPSEADRIAWKECAQERH
jgi:hypothetical protein